MTKEEVIEILGRFVIGAKPCSQREIVDACAFAYRMLKEQPSLPSNLDKAAEEYAYNNWEDNDYHTGASEGLPFDAIGHAEKCFRAGAEWMAGQFQKIDGDLVDWYSTGDGKDYCCGVKTIDSFEVPEGFYIRKKQ